MIVPWLKGFLDWHTAPMTWALIFLNFFIFCLTFGYQDRSSTKEFANVDTMVLTGKLFYQYQNRNSPVKVVAPLHSTSQWMILGGQALRDSEFIEMAPTLNFAGDQIQIQKWKSIVRSYQRQIFDRSSRLFGLHSANSSGLAWITYQFMHAGWMHLIGNMMMLLLFGAALEQAVGSVALVVIYLLSGMAGAGMFILLTHNTLAPMVGASGSLSGVMAFYAAFEKRKRVPFFYFISPMQGYYGWIYLPTLMLFPLSFLSDFAGYMSTPIEIGAGIAYSAHIGGSLFGALSGFSIRALRKNIWWQWVTQH